MKNKKSVYVCIALCAVTSLALLIFAFFAPMALKKYAELRNYASLPRDWLLGVYYFCLIPAISAILSLFKLLFNINSGRVFIQKNVTLIGIIAISCLTACAICAVGAYKFPMLLVIAFAAGFMSVVTRVVKSCFSAACVIKTENELTI